MREQEALLNYIEISNQEIDEMFKKIDFSALSTAKEIILNAEKKGNRVHFTGIGKPSYVAGYSASLFSSTGTPSYVLHGTEAIHGSAGQVIEGDVVIAISNSGETQELKATVETIKSNGAKLIAVTRDKNSWLATTCDICLVAGVSQEGDTLNKPPRSSILAEIIVLQCLSVLLQYEKEITPEIYVKWHPGGSLGKSIQEGK